MYFLSLFPQGNKDFFYEVFHMKKLPGVRW